MESLLENESQIRLGVFLGLFLLMALLETLMPRRARTFKRRERWLGNLGIMVVGALIARVVLPWVPISVAFYAAQNGIGLLNTFNLDGWFFLLLGVLVLDFMIYVQHVIVHKVPIFWRLHRLHHADMDYDVTTGIRFHPIEIILSLLYKMALILIFGVDPVSVVIFEIILNGMAMFNHANFSLPRKLDGFLRLVFVTPDFHRVHHSSIQRETDSNYGFNISLWDRIFGTYVPQPKLGHTDMEIGLEYFRDKSQLGLKGMLVQPFKKAE